MTHIVHAKRNDSSRFPPELCHGHTTSGSDDFFREHFARLVAVVRPLTRDHKLAEDVAQEALERLYAGADSLDLTTPIWPWLKTVAVRLAIDQLRRDRRETSAEGHVLSALGESEGRVDRYYSEDGPQLTLALRKLPRRQRIAVALRYLEDTDPGEAATSMGVSKPAFEQLLDRARRKLVVEYRRVLHEAQARVLRPLPGR